MSNMTQAEYIKFYQECEQRAKPAAGGRSGKGGKAFLKDDRYALVAAMWEMKKTSTQLGYAIEQAVGGTLNIHTQRLRLFEQQVKCGEIRLGCEPTGEFKRSVVKNTSTPVGVQAAFDHAISEAIKVGITDPEQAFVLVVKSYNYARTEQKIDRKVEHLVKELQMSNLTKDQVHATLDRVKKSF